MLLTIITTLSLSITALTYTSPLLIWSTLSQSSHSSNAHIASLTPSSLILPESLCTGTIITITDESLSSSDFLSQPRPIVLQNLIDSVKAFQVELQVPYFSGDERVNEYVNEKVRETCEGAEIVSMELDEDTVGKVKLIVEEAGVKPIHVLLSGSGDAVCSHSYAVDDSIEETRG
jgi:hypothetical protein